MNPITRLSIGLVTVAFVSGAFAGDPCGVPGSGDCFAANGSPGCDDASCCNLVCSIDSFCCDVAWDSACVVYAQENCDPAGSPCGDPGAGDCFVANGTPGCQDEVCCDAVCAIDPFCCQSTWDSTCVTQAGSSCDGGGGGDDPCGDPGAGDCFVSNGTPGCEDEACCDAVCLADAFCCETSWDQECVTQAESICDGGGGGDVPNDTCGNAIPLEAGDHPFSTIGATAGGPDLPGECDEGFGTGFAPDIWYSITPEEDTGLIVSTCGQADYDTRLAAYASCGGQLVACNDDGEGCPEFSSLMSFPALAGQTYLIRVGGYGTAVGSGTLSVTLGDVPPPYPTEIVPQWTVEAGGNGHHYAVVRIPEDSTFATVEATAARFGAQLAAVRSSEETDFVRDFVRVSDPGIYDRCAFGLVQAAKGPEPGGGWFWLSGEALDWTNWRAGEPNDNPAPEDFGEIYVNGEWNDCFDADFGQVLLEWDADPGIMDGVVWEVADGGNGHRYQAVIVYPEIDWETARQAAEAAGGRLVTLETQAEMDWVYENLVVFTSLWDQPVGTGGNGGPFVGLENVAGTWRWLGGEALDDPFWYPGEPSGDGPVAHFFSLNGDGPVPLLNDLPIDSPQRSYIIEFGGGGGTPCPADFDGDGEVGGSDFGILLTQWGPCEGCPGDLDGDGEVEGPDLGALLVQWGDCPDP